MIRQLIGAAALACLFCSASIVRADDSVPPTAFSDQVDPATIPARPDPAIIDEAEIRLITPLLFTDKFAEDSRLWIDGWLAQSYNFNPYMPASRSNGPVGFIDRANEWRLNQWYVRAGRTIDPTLERFDFGGQVDALYGSDAEFVQALGLDRKIILDNKYYRMAIPQAFGSAYFPVACGLTLTAGKFYKPFGLDVPTAVGGFFPTKPYALVYGPFTLTGATAALNVGENWSILGGVVRGWDQWTDANNGLSGLSSIRWKSTCGSTKFALSALVGPEQDEPRVAFTGVNVPGRESALRALVCGTFEHRFSRNWRYAFQGDWGWQENATAAGDAAWYGAMQILRYELNDCYSFGVRTEWFRDADGFRVIPGRPSQPHPWTGTAADYYAVSLGAQIRANAWMTLRPELRWDWQVKDNDLGPRAFDDGTKGQQFLAVVDFVIRY